MQTTTQRSLSQVFQALGDESRFRIVNLLRQDRELCVSEVASEIGITTAAISQHMKTLEKAGLVAPERNGQKICYRLKAEDKVNRQLFKLIK